MDLFAPLEQDKTICGVDEVGRGPLAGPVVAAAAIIPKAIYQENFVIYLKDSKKLSHDKREMLFDPIIQYCPHGIGMASVEEIDTINILQATFLAMRRAVDEMLANFPDIRPDIILVDGNKTTKFPYPSRPVVRGDDLHKEISAASIIAKVTRDRIMTDLAKEHPHYGWDSNAGYGTAAHMNGIASHGITPHHRKNFAPIRNAESSNRKTA